MDVVNNAAQTIRRPPAYYKHLLEFEAVPVEKLPENIRNVVKYQHITTPRLTESSIPSTVTIEEHQPDNNNNSNNNNNINNNNNNEEDDEDDMSTLEDVIVNNNNNTANNTNINPTIVAEEEGEESHSNDNNNNNNNNSIDLYQHTLLSSSGNNIQSSAILSQLPLLPGDRQNNPKLFPPGTTNNCNILIAPPSISSIVLSF